jgi:GDP-L-fucose synthase
LNVLVTGGTGLLGHALRRVAPESGHEFRFISSRDGNLESSAVAERLIELSRPDCIIHAAAVVGGIQYNAERPKELYERNCAINRSVLDAALRRHVPKVISFLSTCIFPEDAPQPWDETMVHQGKPDHRHWGYARAKRLLDVWSREYTDLSGGRSRFVTLMPTTMYGPNENFHPERSHVLPAILLKLYRAQEQGHDLELWGSGDPRREFLLSLDMARVVLWAVERYDDAETMIVSPSTDVSIRELAEQIAELMGFRQEIIWDTTKPDGTPSRRTSNAKFKELLPDFTFMPLRKGLALTLDQFRRNLPRLRGLDEEDHLSAQSCKQETKT